MSRKIEAFGHGISFATTLVISSRKEKDND